MKLLFIAASVVPLFASTSQHAQSVSSAVESDEPTRILQEVRRFAPRISAPESESEAMGFLPAHYSNISSETQRRAGPALSGEDYYLFPDHSYFYIQWADIMQPTIYDRGIWLFQKGFVELQSDHTLQQKELPRDRRFIPLYYDISGKHTLLLMGTGRALPYFKKHADLKDDFMLFICTIARIEPIEASQAEALRKKLYSTGWRPDFLKK